MSAVKSILRLFLDPKQWYPPPDRNRTPSTWFLPITQVSFMCSTMVPRDARIKIVAPALLFLVSRTRAITTGDSRDFLRAGHIFSLVMKFIDFGILVKDGEEFKIRDADKTFEQRKADHEKKSIWQRAKQSVELWLFTMRGIGWNWQVKGIPQENLPSVKNFLFRTTLRCLATVIAWDLCNKFMGSFAYIQTSPRAPFFAQPLLNQVVLTWLHQLEAFCFINLPYQIAAFVTVAFSFQAPNDWPPLFGHLSDAYLVGKAWGRTWHQLLRRQFGIVTPYVQRWLGTTERAAKRSVSLLCSFTMSGLYHWSGVLNMPWTPTSSGMFWYFLIQAPVIRLEDYVIDWGRSKDIKSTAFLRIFGYIWTIGWISFSMRYAAAWQYESGALSQYQPFKLSITDVVVHHIL